MAKDYSWFKFKLPDWMMGRIQKQKPEVRGVFLNLACKYWQKQCKLSIVDAKEELEEVACAYDSLLAKKIIKEQGDMITISFLDEQWSENMELFEKQSKGGKIAAAKRNTHEDIEVTTKSLPSDLQGTTKVLDSDLQVSSCIKNEIREEENREDKNDNENNPPDSDSEKPDTVQSLIVTGGETELFTPCKNAFLDFYKEKFKTDYYFTPMDGNKLKSILKKIVKKTKEKYSGQKEKFLIEDISSSFYWFYTKAYELGGNWLQSNFSLKNLDTQFNEIYTTIKSGKQPVNNKKPTANVHQTALSPSKSGFGSL